MEAEASAAMELMGKVVAWKRGIQASLQEQQRRCLHSADLSCWLLILQDGENCDENHGISTFSQGGRTDERCSPDPCACVPSVLVCGVSVAACAPGAAGGGAPGKGPQNGNSPGGN